SGLARAYFMLRLATGADPDRFVALYETFLDEAQAADAAVVVWSESDFGSRLDDEITRISAQYAVVYLALHEKRLPQFDDDPHYTPEGNRLAAEQLLPAVRAAID
ncbi:MAG TPA: hypothetical protein VEB21_01885, partial [Terriglobales bacterium]|nr:hypothetical protein [Terriglobales bacterium]